MSSRSGYEGDYNKWYPSYRRVSLLARMIKDRRMLIDKAERLCGCASRTFPTPIMRS